MEHSLKLGGTNYHFKWGKVPKKNVVIVVDESGSMSIPSGGFKNPNTTLRVVMAREAAITVLETLSPSDHVCTT
jgi:hypothetical protein